MVIYIHKYQKELKVIQGMPYQIIRKQNSCIPTIIIATEKTTKLDLQFAPISSISDFLIGLTYLDISHTKIEIIPSTFINLETLDISRTHIKELPSTLTKLSMLNVNYTPVRFLPDEFVNIQYLAIYGSYISRVPNTYKKLTNLYAGTIEFPIFEMLKINNISDFNCLRNNELYRYKPETYKRIVRKFNLMTFLPSKLGHDISRLICQEFI